MDINEFAEDLKANREYFYQFSSPVISYWHWTASRYKTILTSTIIAYKMTD